MHDDNLIERLAFALYYEHNERTGHNCFVDITKRNYGCCNICMYLEEALKEIEKRINEAHPEYCEAEMSQ